METDFQLICLWLLSAHEALASEHGALLPFVPLMEGGQLELEAAAIKLRQVADERARIELAQHLVMLGGLRYNPHEILELVGRKSMILLQELRESSYYQMILAEGREKGRQATTDLFRLLAGTRFPGIELGAELETVQDLDAA
jgi:predicted transposase YdaD